MRVTTATNKLLEATTRDSFEDRLDREARIANAVGAIVSFILAATMLVSVPFLLQ